MQYGTPAEALLLSIKRRTCVCCSRVSLFPSTNDFYIGVRHVLSKFCKKQKEQGGFYTTLPWALPGNRCTKCYHLVIRTGFPRQKAPAKPGLLRLGAYSHSLRLNTLCIISVCLIPSGDSDSLWYSYSTACTTSGYHFVIRVITRRIALLWRIEDFHRYSIAQNRCWRKRKDISRINAFVICPSTYCNL